MEAKKDLKSISTRERVLDAAEEVFAASGFEGAAMKQIAEKADVAQGLLHYHFKTKDGLYAAVVGRRASVVNTARLELLDAVDLAGDDALQGILEAFLRPPLEPQGRRQAYARMLAGLAASDERDTALVAEHYDPVAKRFIAALQVARPQARPTDLAWAYNFALGCLVVTIGRSGRPARLIDETNGDDTETLVTRIVTFTAGGLEALLA